MNIFFKSVRLDKLEKTKIQLYPSKGLYNQNDDPPRPPRPGTYGASPQKSGCHIYIYVYIYIEIYIYI